MNEWSLTLHYALMDKNHCTEEVFMNVLIVDDDCLVCDSLRIILAAHDDIEVIGTATGGADAMRLFDQLHPDVVLMDIQMPGMSGLAAAERMLARDSNARIVFLTTFSDDDYIVQALHLGARGYLIKQDVATIAPALRSVMRGQSVLEGEVLDRISNLHTQESRYAHNDETSSATSAKPSTRPACFSSLTEREYEVAYCVAKGLDNHDIAQTLSMSEGTVRNHISTILSKLHLRNRTQIAVAFYRGQ